MAQRLRVPVVLLENSSSVLSTHVRCNKTACDIRARVMPSYRLLGHLHEHGIYIRT